MKCRISFLLVNILCFWAYFYIGQLSLYKRQTTKLFDKIIQANRKKLLVFLKIILSANSLLLKKTTHTFLQTITIFAKLCKNIGFSIVEEKTLTPYKIISILFLSSTSASFNKMQANYHQRGLFYTNKNSEFKNTLDFNSNINAKLITNLE